MGRPILVVKNIETAPRRYTTVAKKGAKAVRSEFGLPFALQDIIKVKPRAKSAILALLQNGDRFDGQRLNRLARRAEDLKVPEVIQAADAARLGPTIV